jgi:CheY-like chemotaxis protein
MGAKVAGNHSTSSRTPARRLPSGNLDSASGSPGLGARPHSIDCFLVVAETSMTPPPATPIRLALAEDDADFRKALTRLLSALGHQVVADVSNGQELVDLCTEREVDLVIADLDMPVLDGLEVAELLAQRGIPVILLSGHSDAVHLNVEREPIAARLLKPVSQQALESAIQRAVAASRARNGAH